MNVTLNDLPERGCQICMGPLNQGSADFTPGYGQNTFKICLECNKLSLEQLTLALSLTDRYNPVWLKYTLTNQNFIRAVTRNMQEGTK